ncbi:MAG: hypothetical protein ACE37D_17245, partial [Pseudomonadales bacterium]
MLKREMVPGIDVVGRAALQKLQLRAAEVIGENAGRLNRTQIAGFEGGNNHGLRVVTICSLMVATRSGERQ